MHFGLTDNLLNNYKGSDHYYDNTVACMTFVVLYDDRLSFSIVIFHFFMFLYGHFFSGTVLTFSALIKSVFSMLEQEKTNEMSLSPSLLIVTRTVNVSY